MYKYVCITFLYKLAFIQIEIVKFLERQFW